MKTRHQCRIELFNEGVQQFGRTDEEIRPTIFSFFQTTDGD